MSLSYVLEVYRRYEVEYFLFSISEIIWERLLAHTYSLIISFLNKFSPRAHIFASIAYLIHWYLFSPVHIVCLHLTWNCLYFCSAFVSRYFQRNQCPICLWKTLRRLDWHMKLLNTWEPFTTRSYKTTYIYYTGCPSS